eukprot:4665368-Amphidinium_carterae.1
MKVAVAESFAGDCPRLRGVLLGYLETARRWSGIGSGGSKSDTGGAAPMEVDNVYGWQRQGKGKGKGKPDSKGKGKGKDKDKKAE